MKAYKGQATHKRLGYTAPVMYLEGTNDKEALEDFKQKTGLSRFPDTWNLSVTEYFTKDKRHGKKREA